MTEKEVGSEAKFCYFQRLIFSLSNMILYYCTKVLYLNIQEYVLNGQPHHGVFFFSIYAGGPLAVIGVLLNIFGRKFLKLNERTLNAYNYLFLLIVFLFMVRTLAVEFV